MCVCNVHIDVKIGMCFVVADYDRQISKLAKSVRDILPELATESGVRTYVCTYMCMCNDIL